jgi:hypothetical protein
LEENFCIGTPRITSLSFSPPEMNEHTFFKDIQMFNSFNWVDNNLYTY